MRSQRFLTYCSIPTTVTTMRTMAMFRSRSIRIRSALALHKKSYIKLIIKSFKFMAINMILKSFQAKKQWSS